MSVIGNRTRERLQAVDPIWLGIRDEALAIGESEPALSGFIYATILNHDTLEAALAHRVASRLGHPDVPAALIVQAFGQMAAAEPAFADTLRIDLQAVFDRDPACERYVEPLLYFKGFHAIQAHRLAHWLWQQGRRDFALYIQSRSSSVFQTDIHPAMQMGRGIFLDHATGLVVGFTARIGDNVSILQDVTLGGTGKEFGDRHPKIGDGVLIGAGAKILGNIEIGRCSRIAAGSVVLKEVPPNSTVAGVPAKIIGTSGCPEPARSMDQCTGCDD
ncbi:serine O-acetyltransferase [Aureimonas altamirensis]|jgi:serine O-acetyltransferase|uniref:Serine acetyltransferase n=1 Tax=Aureimonas altamirensis DSM 21988 TaxID=1121026 RepID=A0ABY1I551_9HYPH|nr:serine O-acetyltransferase [Aureimonas altamirensis]SHI61605.1 serine O-acetyltransferase [Aureimonas altamirensis DSM 21988]